METITSISNAKIQNLKSLIKDRNERWNNREYIVEGMNIVDDMPKSLIKEIYVLPSLYDKYSQWDKPCYTVNLKVMSSISDTVTPQGVIVLASMRTDNCYDECANCEKDLHGVSVVLDNLNDPGNVGTIIRTAAACNVNNIILYGQVCDPYSPKAVRASMGGIFYINVSKKLPKQLYVLDMGGKNIYDLKNTMPCDFALVVGSEAHGVSSELRMAAAEIISLPMSGCIESLNAGVSLSVALYHMTNILTQKIR